jgi:hypothetical protein
VVYRSVDARLREAIAAGRLSTTDCSGAIAEHDVADGYVDATHYSPLGARCILGPRAR